MSRFSRRRNQTLSAYAPEWLSRCTSDPATSECHRLRLRVYLLPHLGSIPLRRLSPADVQQWLATMTVAGRAPATVAAAFSTLRLMLRGAEGEGLIRANSNPCESKSVTLPKQTAKVIVPWSGAQVAAVRRHLPPRFAAMCDVGAGLGLRQGEVFGLGLEDFDLDAGTVHVRRQVKRVKGKVVFAPPKGGRERILPLSARVRDAIARHVMLFPAAQVILPWRIPGGAPHAAHLLFIRPASGTPVDRPDFNRRMWRPAVVAAGIEPGRNAGMHQLRHHFASQLAARGTDIATIAALLGHADVATTAKYIHAMTGATGPAARAAVDSLSKPATPRRRKPRSQSSSPPGPPAAPDPQPVSVDLSAFGAIAAGLPDVADLFREVLRSHPYPEGFTTDE